MSDSKLDKWYIILNPVAGGGKATRLWPKMKVLFEEHGFDIIWEETKGKRHATELAEKAVLAGYKNIIAIGGDGTNNEAVNGIFGQDKVSTKDICYTLIPIGTGNDWIKTHQIPKDYKKWIPLIKRKKIFKQDLGWVKYWHEGQELERYFVNVAGMAYDGYIGKISNERKGAVVSKFVYLSLVISQLFKYRNKRAAVIYNNEEFEAEFYTVNVGICKYSGGGMQLVPHAIPNDGLLALTYDKGLSKLGVIGVTPRLFLGNIDSHPMAVTKQVRMVRVEAREEAPTYLEVDGEFIGQTPCEFHIMDQVLNVIVP